MKNGFQSNFPKYVFLLVISILLLTNVNGQSRKANLQEQTSFSSEEKISSPVKIPPNVLKQLAEYDDRQLEKCQRDKLTRKPNVAAHFAASKTNLNDDNQPDLIVQAQTLCFMGAHNTTFWLFTNSGQKSNASYKLTFDIAAD